MLQVKGLPTAGDCAASPMMERDLPNCASTGLSWNRGLSLRGYQYVTGRGMMTAGESHDPSPESSRQR